MTWKCEASFPMAEQKFWEESGPRQQSESGPTWEGTGEVGRGESRFELRAEQSRPGSR